MPILQPNDQQFQGSSTRRHFEAFNLLDTECVSNFLQLELLICTDLHSNCCGLLLSTDMLKNTSVGATREDAVVTMSKLATKSTVKSAID